MSTPLSSATLVLVHGAWHGSWCWQRLLPLLAQRGIQTRTLELPSVHGTENTDAQAALARGAALSADAAAVRSLIGTVDAPVILCGHSYGGMVISQALDARVRELIYLCAFVPEPGQSLVAIGGGREAPWIQMLENGLTLPDPAQGAQVFYADCDAETQRWALARLKPQRAAAFAEPVPHPAWQTVPSTYIVCAQDMAIPPELQRLTFAPRARRILELDTSHSPFLSNPAALADALAQVVRDPCSPSAGIPTGA
ncbi:MAG TPA: alpha/beta hydrolase [Steroidobacteraceae bacterium]|nr:alpha/beta hydrolase [Steroidobacteraceae bacterium]